MALWSLKPWSERALPRRSRKPPTSGTFSPTAAGATGRRLRSDKTARDNRIDMRQFSQEWSALARPLLLHTPPAAAGFRYSPFLLSFVWTDASSFHCRKAVLQL